MSYTTKKFIKNWNFPNPDWSSLPKGFPKVSKKDLTREEKHLLDGIKLVWLATDTGKEFFYKNNLRLGVATVSILFIVLLGISAVRNLEGNHTKSVNAATISATLKRMTEGVGNELNLEGIVESTMSAARRAIKP